MPAVMERPGKVRQTRGDVPTYMAVVRRDDDSGGWWVEFPELRGCVTEGRTPKEVRRNVAEVLELWFETVPDAPDFYNVEMTFDPAYDVVKVREVKTDTGTIRTKDGDDWWFFPSRDRESGAIVIRDERIGVDVFGETRADAVDALNEQLAMLWTEYAKEDDAVLDTEARKLKAALLSSFEEAADAEAQT